MNPTHFPIACELFGQWRRARGQRIEAATRPFSRGWEQLLDDAGIVSAMERREAERDAAVLAKENWLELKPVQYRPYLFDRVLIPLAAESRWREAFGFAPPSDEEARLVREFPWAPELAFLSEARIGVAFEDLRRLNDFLSTGGQARSVMPVKERSLEIFGDEKRLDALIGTTLFREDRLTLDHLRCFIVAEPLGWRRGPASPADLPVLVLENVSTWDSYCRWNERMREFAAVVYGAGNRFADSAGALTEIYREIGGMRAVYYFGDIDVAGLRIPQRAAKITARLGLPPIEPDKRSYRWLLEGAGGNSVPAETGEEMRREECDWLGELAEAAWRIIARGHRLAQEHVNSEFLAAQAPA